MRADERAGRRPYGRNTCRRRVVDADFGRVGTQVVFVQGAGGDGRVGRIGRVGAGGLAVVRARREPPGAPSALRGVGVGVGVAMRAHDHAAAAGACKGGTLPGGRLTCGRVLVVDLLAVHVERRARRTQAAQPAAALQRHKTNISLQRLHKAEERTLVHARDTPPSPARDASHSTQRYDPGS